TRSTGAFTSKRSSILNAIPHLRADNNTFSTLRDLCVLCASAVNENEKPCKPQRRRGRRGHAEKSPSVWSMLTLMRLPSYDRGLPTVDTLSLYEKSIPM